MSDRAVDSIDLEAFWEAAPSAMESFRPEQRTDLPAPARRYLEHAIAPGTALAQTVRLTMHGEIKLRGWLPFEAEQVIRWDRGMIWKASVRMFGLPIRGTDRLVDGVGAQRWKLLGLIPVMSASGPDISRSTAGRLAAETVWLPSVLAGEDVAWTALDAHCVLAHLAVQGHPVDLTLTVGDEGQLEAVKLPRWGNPNDGPFREVDFGGLVEEERTIDGYTVPTRLRIGWYLGSERFGAEGEFFRVTVDRVTFR